VIRGHSQSPILELFPSPSLPSSYSSEPVLESCARRRRRPAHEHPVISHKTLQPTPDRRKGWRQIQETMRPLIIVNHRPLTTRALKRLSTPPAFLTAITPLRGRRQSRTQMTTTERGLRARTIITLFTHGAKTSITRQHPPRHPTSPPSCLPPLRRQCPALHALRTPPPPALPLQTPSVETVYPPTALLAQIPPILPPVVSPQAPRILQQAPSQRQSLDFPSPLIGCNLSHTIITLPCRLTLQNVLGMWEAHARGICPSPRSGVSSQLL
jgi:hypothetical protein